MKSKIKRKSRGRESVCLKERERERERDREREREKERETSLGTGFQRNGPIISLVKNANEILDVRKLDYLIRSDATRDEL